MYIPDQSADYKSSVNFSASTTTNQIILGKHEKSKKQLVNKKTHQAQTKVKSGDGNNTTSNGVSQQQTQCQQHKQKRTAATTTTIAATETTASITTSVSAVAEQKTQLRDKNHCR